MSPDSVQVKAEAQDYAHQSTFLYDMAHGLPLTPSVSAHGWQDHSIAGTTACYSTALSAPDYGGLSFYQQQQYTDPTMVSTASVQYPLFTSSPQVQGLYYHAGYSFNQTSHPEFAQITRGHHPHSPTKIQEGMKERILNPSSDHPLKKPSPYLVPSRAKAGHIMDRFLLGFMSQRWDQVAGRNQVLERRARLNLIPIYVAQYVIRFLRDGRIARSI
ncbi:hypothetical protein TSTA_020200 [Talaromyces stipitatus ATCC 10500]|uniref:Uncharacterized protein n=1 Tax=Talaromyces stipitatus (strain ATCC 10500 / CBS 375.48 / QM 6759 / NRRL 1006) TaxID=441959 RepID=B8MES8_TALSN|nr:uncharacterized protein TSTA_020200 [Talaromyces stipitatus ATCC 10500]EED16961.1 hypothetical protein TSTA_020200 [Talaromyces stipitatus ATCC 10500]